MLSRVVSVRLSEEEWRRLEAICKATGLNRSKVMRLCFRVVVVMIESGVFNILRPLPEISKLFKEIRGDVSK